ncbi:MAG: protein-disulfide reductase DsbD family protein [Calditrichia bacterium]
MLKQRFIFVSMLLFFVVNSLLANSAKTDHVEAELVPEVTTIVPGEAFWVGLHMKIQDHWHVYWRNAGDAGLATAIDWELPEGFSAGEIQWPHPEAIPFDEFMNFGYENEVLLLVQITPPANLAPGSTVTLKANASWLVCKDVCIPENVDLELPLAIGEHVAINAAWTQPFADTRAMLPITNSGWKVQAAKIDTALVFEIVPPEWVSDSPGNIRFFPYDELVINNGAVQEVTATGNGYRLNVPLSPDREGDPERISGVLVSENGWRGTGSEKSQEISVEIGQSLDSNFGTSAGNQEIGSIWWALLFAFVGGMILNLMPCVLPVLSLKILGFVQQAGEDSSKVFSHGMVFTLGVLVSFWVLAGALLLLRAGGEQLGWGFQLQSPSFIVVLAIFLFLFGLNLFGVFELGTSLMGVGQGAASRSDYLGSFVSGVTATVVATPCTAPFMGSALGFALSQPALLSMAIFTALGMGMALPYVLLASSPGLLKFVPKPGAWMDTLKQSMGFLMMATVIWLLYVLDGQVGSLGVFVALLALLVVSFGGWVLGRWGTLMRSKTTRLVAKTIAAVLIVGSAWLTIDMVGDGTASASAATKTSANAAAHAGWEPYSPELVNTLRAQGKPVFIDFTASWCLSCQVNKKVALNNAEVEAAFASKGVTRVIADWTSKDENITRALAAFGRNSVPLYVLYGAGSNEKPIVLPELLTPGLILDALARIN